MLNSIKAIVFALAATASIAANARIIDGDTAYTPPTVTVDASTNSREYPIDFDKTWHALIAYLSDHAFVIDTIQKDSGLLTLSFSVQDPRSDLDCGHVSAWVKNMRGRRDYAFDAASPREHYEIIDHGVIAGMDRSLDVSGKINIFVSTQQKTTTRVKVTARYVVTKSVLVSPLMLDLNFQRVAPQTHTEVASFNTGEDGKFPQSLTTCRSRGTIEGSLLDGVGKAVNQLWVQSERDRRAEA